MGVDFPLFPSLPTPPAGPVCRAQLGHGEQEREGARGHPGGNKPIQSFPFGSFRAASLIFMPSHLSSVIDASITPKEMYLVSHLLNCINWKRGLPLCPAWGEPSCALPAPRARHSLKILCSTSPSCSPLFPGVNHPRWSWRLLPPPPELRESLSSPRSLQMLIRLLPEEQHLRRRN